VTLLGNRIEARPGEQLRVTVRPDGAFLLE
jgi:hypothetical protein